MKTKKLLCAFLLVALSVLYIGIALINTHAGKTGERVEFHKQELHVLVENGVIADAVDYVPMLIPKDGNYQLNLNFNTSDYGFYTCAVIKDKNGDAAFYTGFYSTENYSKRITLPEGRATLELHYLRTAQDLQDFCKTYPIFTETELANIEDTLHFDDLNDNGNWFAYLELSLYELASVPAYVKWGILAMGMVLLALLFVLFFKDHPTEEDDQKTRLASVSICYAILIFAVFVGELLSSAALAFAPQSFLDNNQAVMSVILTILLIDIAGLALIFFTIKKVPATPPEKKPFGVGQFFLYLLMTAGLTLVGAVIGYLVQNIFPDGTSTDVSAIVSGINPALRIFAVCILAPIVEELIFRKFLIDRLVKHGEFLAILISGLTFGLFHGNFQQSFFTAFVGCLWAYVYIRTGNIRNTIFLHMAMNTCTGCITLGIFEKVAKTGLFDMSDDPAVLAEAMMANPEMLGYAVLMVLWFLFLILLMIAGLIVFIVRLAKKKFYLQPVENEPTKRAALAAAFANPYFWLFLIPLIGAFVIDYLPAVLG